MTEREVATDQERNPPMVYLVAETCPLVATGLAFHACVAGGKLPTGDGKFFGVSCQHLRSLEVAERDGKRFIQCHHGEA